MGQDRLDDMRVVGDAQLVRDRQEQRVGFRDGFIRLELLDENVGLSGIASSKDRPGPFVDEADLVLMLIAAS